MSKGLFVAEQETKLVTPDSLCVCRTALIARADSRAYVKRFSCVAYAWAGLKYASVLNLPITHNFVYKLLKLDTSIICGIQGRLTIAWSTFVTSLVGSTTVQ